MSSGGAEAVVLVAKTIGPKVVGRGLSVFFKTGVGMALLAAIAGVVSYQYAASVSTTHGLIALALVVVLLLVGGVMLSVKRAVASALIHAIDSLDLGPKGLDLIFSRMLDIDDEETHGERGTQKARHAENLPLQQAEARLSTAASRVLQAPQEGGGLGGMLRRKILAVLVEKIELVTLAEFRAEAQSAGGVDLVMVRDRLGDEIDARLIGLMASASRKTTFLFVAGLILVAGLGTWGITQVPLGSPPVAEAAPPVPDAQ